MHDTLCKSCDIPARIACGLFQCWVWGLCRSKKDGLVVHLCKSGGILARLKLDICSDGSGWLMSLKLARRG